MSGTCVSTTNKDMAVTTLLQRLTNQATMEQLRNEEYDCRASRMDVFILNMKHAEPATNTMLYRAKNKQREEKSSYSYYLLFGVVGSDETAMMFLEDDKKKALVLSFHQHLMMGSVCSIARPEYRGTLTGSNVHILSTANPLVPISLADFANYQDFLPDFSGQRRFYSYFHFRSETVTMSRAGFVRGVCSGDGLCDSQAEASTKTKCACLGKPHGNVS
jgi:hypothetical protein